MRSRLIAAIVLLGPFGLLFYFWWHPGAIKTSSHQSAASASAPTGTAVLRPEVEATIKSNFDRVSPPSRTSASRPVPEAMPVVNAPAVPEFTNLPPETVMQNMGRVIRQFGDMFGGNPVGTNPEITAQLAGQNPRHVNFISAEAGLRVNAEGALVDPWGTPFFFHQISGREMEIHSAGPDRRMWTADDLVVK